MSTPPSSPVTAAPLDELLRRVIQMTWILADEIIVMRDLEPDDFERIIAEAKREDMLAIDIRPTPEQAARLAELYEAQKLSPPIEQPAESAPTSDDDASVLYKGGWDAGRLAGLREEVLPVIDRLLRSGGGSADYYTALHDLDAEIRALIEKETT